MTVNTGLLNNMTRLIAAWNAALPDAVQLMLYTADGTPGVTGNFAALTEAAFPGYARATLNAWAAAFLIGNVGVSQEVLHAITCTAGPSLPIAGWGIVTAGNVLITKRPDPLTPILATGQSYDVIPVYQNENFV